MLLGDDILVAPFRVGERISTEERVDERNHKHQECSRAYLVSLKRYAHILGIDLLRATAPAAPAAAQAG